MSRLLLALALAGCVKPVPVDILTMRPATGRFGTPRACTLSVDAVVDRRPAVEQTPDSDGSTPALRYLVPLLLINFWETSGPRYANPELYAHDMLPDLKTLLGRTLDASGLCAGAGPGLSLRPTLQHYYGLSYEKTLGVAGFGGGTSSVYAFFPAAQVVVDLELLQNGAVLDRVTLSERYLFNDRDVEMSTPAGTTSGSPLAIAQARTQAPKLALERLLLQVPDAVDRMLSRVPGATIPPAEGSFLVVRLTREYDFQEEMRIETATGRIITDRVVRRRLPVLGAPGEWVVAPIDAAGRWLDPSAYARLVAQLGGTYKVAFDTNLSVASFGGVK